MRARARRRFVEWTTLVLLGSAIAACTAPYSWAPAESTPAYGPVRSEADAIAAANVLTEFSLPIQVVGVRRGRAGELYRGPLASSINEEAAREQLARLERQAWRVDLTGSLEGTTWGQQLIIDEATGTVLFRIAWEGPTPPYTE